jgi:hypothetical protein
MKKQEQHPLVAFLAIYAERYARENGLDGLHPVHYALMEKYGAPMRRFKRATLETMEAAHDRRQCNH